MENNDNRPLIASYTEIAALLSTVQDFSLYAVLWKYELYSNLCWDSAKNVLFICGKYNHNTYEEFDQSKYLTLQKLSKQVCPEEWSGYIENGYHSLMPVNTNKMGITDVAYIHDVYVVGVENGNYLVYDFWTPSFVWQCKKIPRDILFDSIDFDNPDTVQMFYLFKENKQHTNSISVSNAGLSVRSALLLQANKKKNNKYDYTKSVYGLEIYQAMIDRLCTIDRVTLIDSQNFHVLSDHLKFNKYCVQVLFQGINGLQGHLEAYDRLISKALKLRMYMYKYMIAKKAMNNKESFIKQLRSMMEEERDIITALLERGRI